MEIPARGEEDLAEGRHRLFVLAGLVGVYTVVLLALDGLRFPPRRDEIYFWPTVLHFSREGPFDLDVWRSYDQGMTPLAFALFGSLERVTGGGIVLSRWLNLALSFVMVAAIALPRNRSWRPALAAAGLLAFPYYLGVASHLYTDVIAAFCAGTGVLLHRRGQTLAASAAFVLAIATRQYAVAFPVAIAAFELVQARSLRPRLVWIAPLSAAATLFGWILLFGGLAPAAGIATHRIPNAELLQVRPEYALYFLTGLGAYFVLPELVLLRRSLAPPRRGVLLASILGLGALFACFPPLANLDHAIPSMGYLDRAARLVLNDTLRMGLFFGLALLATLRFAHLGRGSLLVLANVLVMLKAQVGWDKYLLLLLPTLWFLTSRGELVAPAAGAGTADR